MGFSVTASNVIFIVAILGVGTVASSHYWTTTKVLEEAKDDRSSLLTDRQHTTMTLVGTPNYQNGPDRYTVTVINDGTTILKVSELDYIVDGVHNTDVESTTVEGSASTDLWMPGETFVLQLRPITSEPDYFAIIAGNGATMYYKR